MKPPMPATRCHLDHLVITAPTLDAGTDWLRRTLGVSPQIGGEHGRMGTHNALLRLGESSYLEVLAPNPNAPRPDRPRWFALDRMSAASPPRLAAWVARTTDIRDTVRASTERLGEVEPMSRGNLNWLITIPADGSLPFQGIAPVLIQWQTPSHPASRLPDSGCSLLRLKLFHREAVRVSSLLEAIGFEGPVSVLPPPSLTSTRLVAEIATHTGRRELASGSE